MEQRENKSGKVSERYQEEGHQIKREIIGKQIPAMWERETYWPEGSEEAYICVCIFYM